MNLVQVQKKIERGKWGGALVHDGLEYETHIIDIIAQNITKSPNVSYTKISSLALKLTKRETCKRVTVI